MHRLLGLTSINPLTKSNYFQKSCVQGSVRIHILFAIHYILADGVDNIIMLSVHGVPSAASHGSRADIHSPDVECLPSLTPC